MLTLAATACLAGGTALIISGSRSHPPAAGPLPSRQFAVKPGPPAAPGAAASPEQSDPCPASVTSSHLDISSLNIDAPIVPTYLQPDGSMAIPYDVHEVGIWNGGAPLAGPSGEPVTQGTTLLVGHVDYVGQGDGALYNLYQVQPGAIVGASGVFGQVTCWRVTSLTVVAKSDLPSWVYAGPTGPRRLVIVTCGGPLDYIPGYGYSYRDNVIATAVPASA